MSKGENAGHERSEGKGGKHMAEHKRMAGMRGMKCCKDGKVSQPSGRGRGRSSKGTGY